MNKPVKNEIAVVENKVTPVKKSHSKKVTPVTTTAVAPVVNNASVTNTKVSDILSFDDTMSLMSEYHIGSKSKTKNYRIINGGSSIHCLKTKYRIYATTVDFELCENIKSTDLQLLKNDNAVDTKRPHTIICGTTATLKKVFSAISKNALNALC